MLWNDQERRLVLVILTIYRVLLVGVLVLGSPWWLLRMVTTRRYRAGFWERLGVVPRALREACSGIRGPGWVWLHAVSVGEVLAASGVVRELLAAGFEVAVSTTTEAGQALARERFAGCPVFYLPLDFGWLVGRYLAVIRPKLVVTMESELWPNLIRSCKVRAVPLAVVNARVSDRSFPRYMRLRRVWGPLLREVSLFLAQSEETAGRLLAMGVAAERVKITGNLKYDVRASAMGKMAGRIEEVAAGRPILVAGSTLGGAGSGDPSEDEMVIAAWEAEMRGDGVLLVLAPRHPARFAEVCTLTSRYRVRMGSELAHADGRSAEDVAGSSALTEIVVLDTIGDLAAVYGVADVAFVGGSLVGKGGHNPLEPARFGVPVVMGESFFNFKEIVGAMLAVEGVRVAGRAELGQVLGALMRDRGAARALGERGRGVFEAQGGALGRTMTALHGLMEGGR